MIPLTIAELRQLDVGRLEATGEQVTGVKIDSRLVEPGDLFVAIGQGKDFLAEARSRGAAATLVPKDAFAAVGALGSAIRERSSARVVGITGSTGKTSTKDILRALCSAVARTVAAEASFNNELGVPLTLCRLEPDTEACVLELAMRGLGQIAALAEIARPQIGVITGVGPVHLELVGTVAAVAQAKAELIEALPPGGVAIVPSDVKELAPYLRREDLELRRFGPGDVLSAEVDGERTNAVLSVGGRELELTFNFVARHHLLNALAALHAYDALGLPLDRAHEGAAAIAFSRWRGEELPLDGGGLLINDAYNANPMSMRAALDHLADRAGPRRRVAVLGDMAELGPDAPRYHLEVGRHASAVGVDVRCGIAVTDVELPDHRQGASVTLGDGGPTIEARIIVGADGPRSIVAREAGMVRSPRLGGRVGLSWHVADEPDDPVKDARMVVLPGGAYCGIAPVPGGRVNIGIVLAGRSWRDRLSRDGAAAVGRDAFAVIPRLGERVERWRTGAVTDSIAGASPLGSRVERRCGPGWAVVGDAAGFLDPFTGEGLHRALVSARLAAEAIDAELRGTAGALAGYDAAMTERFATKDLVSQVVQGFLARPALFAYAGRRLARRDAVRATMGLVMGDLVPASRALDPRFLTALLRP